MRQLYNELEFAEFNVVKFIYHEYINGIPVNDIRIKLELELGIDFPMNDDINLIIDKLNEMYV